MDNELLSLFPRELRARVERICTHERIELNYFIVAAVQAYCDEFYSDDMPDILSSEWDNYRCDDYYAGDDPARYIV